MAEQSGHNVVSNSQSTSGSPLVDAAATTTTAHTALSGTQNSNPAEPTIAQFEPPKPIAGSAIDNIARHELAASDATRNAAEPSAGDVANASANGLAHASVTHVEEKQGGGPDLVNGIRDDASQGDVRDDRSTADVSVDVSINSDTDNSRGDASEKKDGSHHNRTNSVKKPTTFSKVTATKNFMNKIAPAAPTAPKVGEKPSPVAAAVMQPSSKPRLVAKTGASLASLQSKRSGEGPSGPDASKVWNKNRPVQPPPPKQFTDEELKQQYGIHLATRLQTDESGKESKWADIDDDEDDWAPETVVWMDGTKSSIAPQDAAPAKDAQPDPKPASPQPTKPAEGTRPTLSLKSSRPEQVMKILKPGVAASQARQNEQSPAPTPGVDKPSLKAKSPAPAPMKSPWAPVPKIDSVSPINPPVQQQPPLRAPLATQDARAYEPSQPLPAREIAADTFDRSWREGEGGTRELFNSTNGRYEPAPEGRRNSIKPESGYRKPAVLQRPSQGAMGPAEPSAAFQTRSSQQMDGSWGRRRGSSVSQGSMPPRRMSVNQRPDLAGPPEISQDMRSPRSSRGEPVKPTFAQQSVWDQQMPPQPEEGIEEAVQSEMPESAAPMEDVVKAQERLMREKRELAVKRRKEEEEKAEAEKQQRLKAKLAALEGAGKSKKEREAEAAAAAAAAKEARDKEANAAPAPDAKSSQPEPAKPAEASAATAASLESQSLPPAPDHVQQKSAPFEDKLPSPFPPKAQPAGLPDRPLSNEQQRQASRAQPSPRASGRAPYQQPSAQYKTPVSSYSSPGDRKPQPAFGRSPNLATDSFSPWPVTGPSNSVWGTSGIGNGTFDSSSAFAPLPMSQQASSLLPPPGMPRPSGTTRISPQGFNQESRSPSLQPQQATEQQRAFPPPGMESRPDPFANQARLNGVSPAPAIGRQVPHPPGPIGPPSRTQAQTQQPVSRPDPISAWNSATQSLPTQYASNQAAAQERRAKELSGPLPQGQASENRFKETFKKTSSNQGRLGGPRRYESTEYVVHDVHGSRAVSSHSPAPPAPPSTQTQPSAPFPTNSPMQGHWKSSNENAVRIPDGSQNPAHGGVHAPQPPIGTRNVQHAPTTAYQGNVNFPAAPLPPTAESKDQSPPPPENESHPVNQDAGTAHPLVKLPPPAAKVKLPPMSPSSQAMLVQQNNSVFMPPRTMSNYVPPGAARPIVTNEAWQARINGLFKRTAVQTETPPSPPRTPPKVQGPALAVASSSRAQMDEYSEGATVSLPQGKKAMGSGAVADSSSVFTKPAIDELFNEERSFGSMPKVRIPRGAKYNTSAYPPTAKNMLQLTYNNSRLQKTVDSQSRIMAELDWGQLFWQHREGFFVSILDTKLNNKLVHKPGAVGRKPFDKLNNKNKRQGYAPGNHSTTQSPSRGGTKSGYQKPYQRAANNESFSEAGKDARSAGSNERRKSGYARPTRGGRHASGTASAIPVKSD